MQVEAWRLIAIPRCVRQAPKLGVDEMEVGGPLERGFRLDLICPLHRAHIHPVSQAHFMNSNECGWGIERQTVAAGPSEKVQVELRVDWTKVRAFWARN